LTFDRQLTGRRDDLSLSAESYGDLLIGENQRLMEVKILDSMPMWLADCLADLHIYKTSFSKYGTAYKNYIKNKIEYRRRRLNNYA
jgi:hypothetical protein